MAARIKNTSLIWDRFWSNKDPDSIYPPVTDILGELKQFVDLAGKKILEVGAGTGRDSLKMAQKGAAVFLLDYSSESLGLVRRYPKGKEVNLILADARSCPLKDGSFDIVFHQGLLEHFASPYELIRENYRLLKKSGFLVVDVPQAFHFYTILKNLSILLGRWFAGWERQFTAASLGKLLKRSGFEPIHYYGDWSRPGISYKILREILKKISIKLPMFPKYFGPLTKKFYNLQAHLRKKKIFLWTTLSIGIIARKI